MSRVAAAVLVTALLACPWAVERAVGAPVTREYVGAITTILLAELPSINVGDPATLSFTLDWDTLELSALSVTFSGLTYTPRSSDLPTSLTYRPGSPILVAGFGKPLGPTVDGIPPWFINLSLNVADAPEFSSANPRVHFECGPPSINIYCWVEASGMSLVSTRAAASELALNPNGPGHTLLVPYFSTQEGNVTAINIVNTDTVHGKVLKIRFRGASNSDDVYDFQVFLSAGDMWTAGVSQGADGRSQLATTDKSCTLPANVNGSFITSRTSSAGDAAETREGYIEILTMADIIKRSPDLEKYYGKGFNDLYTATEHVNGVPPCTSSVLTALTHENASAYMAEPTTGIMASWTIVNVAKVFAYSGEAAAIEARNSLGDPGHGRLVYWDQRPIPLTTDEANANTADPLLRGAAPAIAGARYDLPDLSTPYLPSLPVCPFCQARELSDAITAVQVGAEFYRETTVGAQTDWVISVPTRRYFAAVKYGATNTIVRNATSDGNIYFTAENTELGNASNGGKPFQICTKFGFSAVSFYDREEVPTIADDIVISPGTPTQLSICGEVSVVGINNDSATNSATFGSVARSGVSNGLEQGWGSLNVPSGNGLPMLVRQFTRVNNTQTNAYYGLSYPTRVVVPGLPEPFTPGP